MSDDYLNSIRMTQKQQSDLLNAIEQAAAPVEDSRRASERIRCAFTGVMLKVWHPDGNAAKFLVSTRNLSSGGISFLHGGFLYPGSRCEITLPTVWDAHEKLAGKVVNCRHVEKHIHEFGIAFNRPIDTRRFVTPPGERKLQADADMHKLAVLAGLILVVDECPMNADLIQHLLKGSRVEVRKAESLPEASVLIRSNAFDTVLLDLDGFGKSPSELIQELRDAGFTRSIVGAASNADSAAGKAIAKEALDAGAEEILAKPVTSVSLVRMLSECLSTSPGASAGAIPCQLEQTPESAELINNYLQYVDKLNKSLSEAIEKDDLDSIRKSCRGLAQSAAGYGYPVLSEAAREVESLMATSKNLEEIAGEILRIQSICSRLEPITLPS